MTAEHWRTVQMFVSGDGVFEVTVDTYHRKNLKCTCPQYAKGAFKKCKHTKYVKGVMDKNDGDYSIQVNADVDDDEAMEAIMDPKEFRKFVIKHAKVIHLD